MLSVFDGHITAQGASLIGALYSFHLDAGSISYSSFLEGYFVSCLVVALLLLHYDFTPGRCHNSSFKLLIDVHAGITLPIRRINPGLKLKDAPALCLCIWKACR